MSWFSKLIGTQKKERSAASPPEAGSVSEHSREVPAFEELKRCVGLCLGAVGQPGFPQLDTCGGGLFRDWLAAGVSATHSIPDMLSETRESRVAAYERIRSAYSLSANLFTPAMENAIHEILRQGASLARGDTVLHEMEAAFNALQELIRSSGESAAPAFDQLSGAVVRKDSLPEPTTPAPLQATTQAVTRSEAVATGTVTDCKTWQCPRCNQVCTKGALGAVWFPGESLDKVHGTGSCPCGAGFPQAEIYGGKYDFRGPRPKEQPASRSRPTKLNIIVFWKGMVPPSNPQGYCQQIVDGKYGEPSVRIDAWRMAGTKNTVDVTEAAALYRMYKSGGQMPDFGDPKDEVEGKGPDGNDIVAFFFWLG